MRPSPGAADAPPGLLAALLAGRELAADPPPPPDAIPRMAEETRPEPLPPRFITPQVEKGKVTVVMTRFTEYVCKERVKVAGKDGRES